MPIELWDRLDNCVPGSLRERRYPSTGIAGVVYLQQPAAVRRVRIDTDSFAGLTDKRKSLFAIRSERMRFVTHSSITG
jgi:hypothetical protein